MCSMTRRGRRHRRHPAVSAAVAGTALSLVVALGAAAPARAMLGPLPGYGGIPLPAAWEMCVLAGVQAPVTAADVADLDVWQQAEGGSTQNDNTYNPFNTRRPTTTSGSPLPETMTPEDFPAFSNWPAGCAATVATILQPNMAPIAAVLVAGGASSPAGYLQTVDTTPWCAPEDGVPCYAAMIAGGAEPWDPSQAMPLLAGTSTTLASYGRQVDEIASIEQSLEAGDEQLAAAQVAVAAARQGVQAAGQGVNDARNALRTLALFEYTSDNQIDQDLNLKQFEGPDQRQELTQYFEGIDATNQLHAYVESQGALARAQVVLGQAQAHQSQVTQSVVDTSSALIAAEGRVQLTLGVLAGQVGNFQTAGTCLGVPAAATTQMVGGLQSCVSTLIRG